jgi:hypothetical protein
VAHADSSAADNQHAQATGGLAGATARGEAARVQWVKDGLVVPGEQLAQAWGSPAKPWRRPQTVAKSLQ